MNIPILYLVSLSILISPITIILIVQTSKFYTRQKSINQITYKHDKVLTNCNTEYILSTMYIYNKEWTKAIITLDSSIKLNHDLTEYRMAQHYNAIGFVLEKNKYSMLAKAYYSKAYSTCNEYNLAVKNLKDLEK
uniref:Photosystem I assembly protein Ycf37 n=1 Tax=Dermonema virens TaxID=1077399 RepID=A0A1G4NRK9_9FLOR|nr:Hypothetical protein ycf37 [Dermonema virens]SCW21274.1 Hypothetical protein ycf37 [Dermonema virens]